MICRVVRHVCTIPTDMHSADTAKWMVNACSTNKQLVASIGDNGCCNGWNTSVMHFDDDPKALTFLRLNVSRYLMLS
jgi:hypothetical protein